VPVDIALFRQLQDLVETLANRLATRTSLAPTPTKAAPTRTVVPHYPNSALHASRMRVLDSRHDTIGDTRM